LILVFHNVKTVFDLQRVHVEVPSTPILIECWGENEKDKEIINYAHWIYVFVLKLPRAHGRGFRRDQWGLVKASIASLHQPSRRMLLPFTDTEKANLAQYFAYVWICFLLVFVLHFQFHVYDVLRIVFIFSFQ